MPVVCTALAKDARVRSHQYIGVALLAASLALGGCAKAISADDGGLDGEPDAGAPIDDEPDAATLSDAAPPDAATPVPVTLTHSASNVIEDESSLRCNDNNNGTHTANSYYRVFDLAAMGVVGDLSVESVSIGIQEAISANDGPQPATVKLYTLEGDFLLENLTGLTSVPVQVPEQTLSILEVPVTTTVPADSVLVLEFFTPAGTNQYSLWVGANDDGQTGPSYAYSSQCGDAQPVDVATLDVDDIDTAAIHWVMSVSGTALP